MKKDLATVYELTTCEIFEAIDNAEAWDSVPDSYYEEAFRAAGIDPNEEDENTEWEDLMMKAFQVMGYPSKTFGIE